MREYSKYSKYSYRILKYKYLYFGANFITTSQKAHSSNNKEQFYDFISFSPLHFNSLSTHNWIISVAFFFFEIL